MQMLDSQAVEWIATRSLLLAKSLNETTKTALREALRAGFADGESIIQIARRIESYFETQAKYRAEMIARTEIITASNKAANDRYKAEGVSKVEWLAARDERLCEECNGLDGQQFPIDSGPRPSLHPNCRCTILPVD